MTQFKISEYLLYVSLIIAGGGCFVLSHPKEALAIIPAGLFIYSAVIGFITLIWKEYKYTEIKWYSTLMFGLVSSIFTAVCTYAYTEKVAYALIIIFTFTIHIYVFLLGATLINLGIAKKDMVRYSDKLARCLPLIAIVTPTGFIITPGIGLFFGALGVLSLWSLRDKATHVLTAITYKRLDYPAIDEVMRWQGSTIISVVMTIASLFIFVNIGAGDRELSGNDYATAILVGVGMLWTITTNLIRVNKIIETNKHMYA